MSSKARPKNPGFYRKYSQAVNHSFVIKNVVTKIDQQQFINDLIKILR